MLTNFSRKNFTSPSSESWLWNRLMILFDSRDDMNYQIQLNLCIFYSLSHDVFWMVIIELNMARLCKSVPRDWGWMGSRCDWWGNFQNFLSYQNKTDTFLRIATNRLKGSNFVITILPWCPDFSTSQCLHSPQPWRRWHFSTFNIARLLVIFRPQ